MSPPSCGYRPRNERGWRKPREGTKARIIYDLMELGHSHRAIVDITGYGYYTTGVTMHCIRNPDKTNKCKAKYYVKPRGPRKPSPAYFDSRYVDKLVEILNMPRDEARRLERELIAKENNRRSA